jgi:hypothetical protein
MITVLKSQSMSMKFNIDKFNIYKRKNLLVKQVLFL